MLALLTTLHLLIAIALILIILLQSSQGTDIAGAFGGMGSQAAFGPRGTATFLSKATIVLAASFMVTAVSLSILASRAGTGGGSVLSGESAAPPPVQPTPAAPTAATPAAPTAATPAAPSPQGAASGGVQTNVPGLGNMGVKVTVEPPTPAPNTPPAGGKSGTAPAPAAAAPSSKTAAPTGTTPAPSGK